MISMIKAKSNGESLEEHIRGCLDIFAQLKEIYPDLQKFTEYPDFYSDIFDALFFHDFGKAAEGFQESLTPNGRRWQYRHEILSIPFIDCCLKKCNLDVVKMLVLTHHKDIDELMEYMEDEYSIDTPFEKRLDETAKNLNELNELVAKYPEFSRKICGLVKREIMPIRNVPKTKLVWEDLLTKKITFPLKVGLFGKGMINACDYLASSGIKKILKPLPDMNRVFTFNSLTDVQAKCLSTKGNTLIMSPTGSGKTEASLFWATNNLGRTQGNRIFYILPYTASINAMYGRLSKQLTPFYSDDNPVSLLHGKAVYFAYKMLEEDKFKDMIDISKKIYSPYKLTTPFQCLKHFFSLKGYEMGLLEMYGGRFIFDEIHSYDARTVGLILSMCEYLTEELDAKILIMSATFPDFIKKIFLDNLHIENKLTMNEVELTKYLRHRCKIIDGNILTNIELIQKRLQNKEKVLVVCNTVGRAQEVYKLLKVNNSALLHGRFILKDRELIERNLEDLNLLVGTQAIEVSLNIDYDVCFTEPAPIDALIQRFGRVNRRKNNKGLPLKGICDVFVFSDGSKNDHFIYDTNLVNRTLKSLNSMDLLFENKIYDVVNDVYSNGFGNKQNEFENTKNLFRRIIDEIVPFKNLNKDECNFYDLFDSVEAVPECYRRDYLGCIKSKNVFDAMQYCLQLTNGQYNKLKRKGQIDVENKIFVNAKYDAGLGLLINEEENSNII